MGTGVLAHVLASLQTPRTSGARTCISRALRDWTEGSVAAKGDYPSLREAIHIYWTFVGYTTEEYEPNYLFSMASPRGFEPLLPP